MSDNYEYDIDAAIDASVERGICPDCGEKINDPKCCSSS
jgi:hypothetical protein